MKRILSVIILVAMVCSVAVAETVYILCNPSASVNGRWSPSINAPVEASFFCGDELETDGKIKKDRSGKRWVHVIESSSEASEVWVYEKYVQDSEVVVGEVQCRVSCKGRVAVRHSPKGKLVKWIKSGDIVTVLAMSDDWAVVSSGYIMRDCLEVIEDDGE